MEIVIVANLIFSGITLLLALLILYRLGSWGESDDYDPLDCPVTDLDHEILEQPPARAPVAPVKRKPVVMDEAKAYELERAEKARRRPIY